MMLRKMLKTLNPNSTDDDIQNIIDYMIEQVELGENPDEVLLAEGLESDYTMDLLEEMM